MSPIFSVIIPVYNVEKYLPQCLDSIINQTVKDIEIICVYDESTDNSLKVLRQYLEKDLRIKIIHSSKKSLGAARNIGLFHASAEYICFVDSDDWIEPDTLEEVLKKINNDIDLVCFGANVITEGDVLDNTQIENAKSYHQIKFTGEINLNDQIISNMTVNVWNKIFRHSIIKNNNIYFPEGITHEDNAFFHKYALISQKAFFFDKYFYNYRQRNDSLISETKHENNSRLFDRMLALHDIYKFLNNKNILKDHVGLFLYLFKLFLFFDYNYCDITNRESLLNKASELANEINLEELDNNDFIAALKNKDYKEIPEHFKVFRYNF